MNFYILKQRKTPNIWVENRISIVSDENWEDRRYTSYSCPMCHDVTKLLPKPPMGKGLEGEFEVAKPYFGDLVPDYDRIFFSKRARDLFLESGLTGIQKFERIEIVKLKAHNGVRKSKLPPMPEYYLAHIEVDGAVMDYKRSKAVLFAPIVHACEYCSRSPFLEGRYEPSNEVILISTNGLDKYMGKYVDVSRWNGNNIFLLLGTGGTTVVDQTFVDWARGNNLTGGCFTPENEPCVDWWLYEDHEEEFGPGLRYDLG